MVESITKAEIIQFSDMVHVQAQQMTSKLSPYVKVRQMTGDSAAYDGLGIVEAREISGRNVAATFDEIAHTRRKIRRKRYVINLPVDGSDVRGVLLNPESEYAKAIAMGALRMKDRIIYDAAFADVAVGRDFEDTVTATTDGVLTVDATAGLTYDKLLELNQNFIDNSLEDERAFLIGTGAEHTQLMQEEEVISADFNRDYVVESGRIKKVLNFDFVTFPASASNPIIPVASSQRQLLCATQDAICLGISKDMEIKIQERNDLFETTQVQVIFEMGAVRTEGARVQKVTVTA